MIIGVPKEIKDNENRVAATPGSVKAFCDSHHRMMVEASAGTGSGIADQEYEKALELSKENGYDRRDKQDKFTVSRKRKNLSRKPEKGKTRNKYLFPILT